jgi:hypothetical protein
MLPAAGLGTGVAPFCGLNEQRKYGFPQVFVSRQYSILQVNKVLPGEANSHVSL